MSIQTNSLSPTPVSAMCFHPSSRLTLSNGTTRQILELTAGDQLIDENGKRLTITRIHQVLSNKVYYRVNDHVLVSGNHLVKTMNGRSKIAKIANLPMITDNVNQFDYHVETNGSRVSHFIPVEGGYQVEVIGLKHRLSKY